MRRIGRASFLASKKVSGRRVCVNPLACKPPSHATLYEWLDMLEKGGDLGTKTVRRWNGRHHETDMHRHAGDVPLRVRGRS